MVEMDGAIGDSTEVQEQMKKQADKQTQALQSIGINFTPKK